MHLILPIFLLMLFSKNIEAQEKPDADPLFSFRARLQDSSLREWGKGPLTWDDFRPESSNHKGNGQIYWRVEAHPATERRGYQMIRYYKPLCFLDKAITWAYTGDTSAASLRYYQLMFNIGELHARKLVFALDTACTLQSQRGVNDEVYHEYVRLREEIGADVQYGRNLLRMGYWEHAVRQSLLDSAWKQRELPEKFSSLHLNGGFSLAPAPVLGSFSDNICRGFMSSVFIGAGWKKHWVTQLSLNFLDGKATRSVQPSPETGWKQGDRVHFSQSGGMVGYRLPVSPRHELVPYAGGGTIRLYTLDPETNKEIFSWHGYHMKAGIQYHFVLSEQFHLLGPRRGRSKTRLCPLIDCAFSQNTSRQVRGFAFIAQIGFMMDVWGIPPEEE